jgi:lysophospholipase L1-like esterase
VELPEGSEYVALGSSYGAGPGLGDRVPGSPRGAARSTHNYAHQLSDRLRLKLTDVTNSGATVAQILGREAGASPTPQLDAVTADTRLVTLTAGGNDVGYIGYLVQASLPALVRAITGTNRRLAASADPAEANRRGAALADDLIALFAAIRERAPKAIIAVTDYLALLPAGSSVSAHPLTREQADRGRQYFALVNLTLRQAAARAGVLFADIAAPSAPHHAWSSDPWTERFVLFGGKAAAYHPTRAGMTAVADAIEAALGAA